MATTKRATYKRFNGTDWDTIYFYTVSGQVQETDGKYFLRTSNTVNGKSFFDASGNPTYIVLTGDDINVSASNTQNLSTYITSLANTITQNNGNYNALNEKVNTLESNINSVVDECNSTLAGFNEDLATLNTDLSGLESRFDTLMKDANVDFDTLKEISDYIATHGSEAADMITAIEANEAAIRTANANITANANNIIAINAKYKTDVTDNLLVKVPALENEIARVDSANSTQIQEAAAELREEIEAVSNMFNRIFYATAEPGSSSGRVTGDILIQYA